MLMRAPQIWDTGMPVWALLLSVLLPVIYVLPSGFIYAVTSQGITLNLLAQIVPGTLLPGKPLANLIFKAYSVQTLTEATSFVQDLKLGHYVKLSPRSTFVGACRCCCASVAGIWRGRWCLAFRVCSWARRACAAGVPIPSARPGRGCAVWRSRGGVGWPWRVGAPLAVRPGLCLLISPVLSAHVHLFRSPSRPSSPVLTTPAITRSTARVDVPRRVPPGRRQGVAVRERARHLHAHAGEPAHVPA
jgi:hypothetical protein